MAHRWPADSTITTPGMPPRYGTHPREERPPTSWLSSPREERAGRIETTPRFRSDRRQDFDTRPLVPHGRYSINCGWAVRPSRPLLNQPGCGPFVPHGRYPINGKGVRANEPLQLVGLHRKLWTRPAYAACCVVDCLTSVCSWWTGVV